MTGVIAFLFAYLDELYLGPIKFGVAWKAMLVFYIALIWLKRSKKPITHQLLFGISYCLKSVIYSYHSLKYFLTDVSEAIKFFILPLAIEFFGGAKKPIDLAEKTRSFLVFFVPLSCAPFLLGMEPLVDKHSLDIYGATGSEFSGIFGTKHGAAVTLAAAFILTLHKTRIKSIPAFLGLGLMLLCAVSLYLTYVRTGLVSLAVGVTVYLLLVYKARAILPLALIFTAGALTLFHLASTNEVLRMRLTGTNIFTEEVSFNQLGSGRLDFWKAAVQGPSEDGMVGVLLGRGLEKTKDYMLDETGLRIFSHNGFLDAYQTNGVIGLIIFIAFWVSILILSIKRRKTSYGPVSLALACEALIIQLVQGGSFFWFQILLASCLASTNTYPFKSSPVSPRT